MPIKKYRSVEERDADQGDLWCEPGEACFRRIARLWKRSAQISPRTFPKGIIKYRSLEEAQADRERWSLEHVRRIQAERKAAGASRIVQHPQRRSG